MSESKIRAEKFIKLFAEREIYCIAFFLIFVLTGYERSSLKVFAKTVFPFFNISSGFTSCFLLFYLFIPFINRLIHALSEKEHIWLIVCSLFVYTFLPSFLMANVTFNYITWFSIVYMIAAYIRMYPKPFFESQKIAAVLCVVSLFLSAFSIIVCAYISRKMGKGIGVSMFLVADSNKILALATALSAFLFFLNLKIGCHKLLNRIAASVFGVLMIHANSDTMRKWLWQDCLNNIGWYASEYFIVHMLVSVAGIYVVCTVIDMLRIHFLENKYLPFFMNIYGKIRHRTF